MGRQFTMGRIFIASADEGFFPKIFGEDMERRVRIPGLLIIAVFQMLLPVISYDDVFRQFNVPVDFSVVTNIFPYLTCMGALFVISEKEKGKASAHSLSVAACSSPS